MPAQALKLAVELRRLRRRWDVYIAEPPPIELSPPLDYACVLEGLASTTDLDLDRVQLAPFALTWSGKVPLLIHHDFDRLAGEIKELSYTKDGSVRCKCHVKGEGARYGAFSVAFEIIKYDLHNTETPHFFARILKAELKELSLVTRPVNTQALVKDRYPLFNPGSFYDLALAKVATLKQLIQTKEGKAA